MVSPKYSRAQGFNVYFFLHGYTLKGLKKYQLSRTCFIESFQSSEAKRIYRYLAERKGVDPEDESGLDAIISMSNVDPALAIEHDVVHAIVVPALAIAFGAPPILVQCIIQFGDSIYPDSRSLYHTKQYSALYEEVRGNLAPNRFFDAQALKLLKYYFHFLSLRVSIDRRPDRMVRALEQLGDACASRTKENAILSIAASMETVLAPYSQGELTHQMAVIGSWLLSHYKEDREGNYKRLKEFYAIRSRVVHGALDLDSGKLNDGLRAGYNLLTSMFRMLASKKSVLNALSNENARRQLFARISLGLI